MERAATAEARADALSAQELEHKTAMSVTEQEK